ncbi:hypothetical protein DVH24_035726 [Malus domestica]|uniref:Uncharacterized protein n=1 Tax=Malus domestica TaxID=3750 RepID=A0A498JMT6_MALDO|nr:hypothetical protein DVH24_035726 [Malus domestica]
MSPLLSCSSSFTILLYSFFTFFVVRSQEPQISPFCCYLACCWKPWNSLEPPCPNMIFESTNLSAHHFELNAICNPVDQPISRLLILQEGDGPDHCWNLKLALRNQHGPLSLPS